MAAIVDLQYEIIGRLGYINRNSNGLGMEVDHWLGLGLGVSGVAPVLCVMKTVLLGIILPPTTANICVIKSSRVDTSTSVHSAFNLNLKVDVVFVVVVHSNRTTSTAIFAPPLTVKLGAFIIPNVTTSSYEQHLVVKLVRQAPSAVACPASSPPLVFQQQPAPQGPQQPQFQLKLQLDSPEKLWTLIRRAESLSRRSASSPALTAAQSLPQSQEAPPRSISQRDAAGASTTEDEDAEVDNKLLLKHGNSRSTRLHLHGSIMSR
ncbi:hypothetical protein GALMADRAFT_139209 [Galerina marginata CBS 339.88]|uniref:Uncharacterized protein n=1 Tax=Galerina marginata (strain CBS 339.88) TaxID=685588 RepID=A0A067T1X1_GALM3|nr:hypothetical protein GALMADRAFT_139209 [Galerina marginata CBS 339.88]